jgi:hypothetical protein
LGGLRLSLKFLDSLRNNVSSGFWAYTTGLLVFECKHNLQAAGLVVRLRRLRHTFLTHGDEFTKNTTMQQAATKHISPFALDFDKPKSCNF